MILFTTDARDDGGKVSLGVGVSRENIKRLTAGQPIVVKLEKLNDAVIDGWIMIMFGETEQDLQRELNQFIGEKTKINFDEKLGGRNIYE